MKRSVFAIGMFLGIVILLSFSNHWIKNQVIEIGEDVDQEGADAAFDSKVEIKAFSTLGKKMVHQSKFEPNRRFTFNKLYADDEKIASFKMKGDNIYDVEGFIPDSKVEFKNQETGEYGEEYFVNGRRDGSFRLYYATGELKEESKYFSGVVIVRKLYFRNGSLMSDEDFQDALYLINSPGKKAGVGRVYAQNGKLIHEWNITTSGVKRYEKAYNSQGILTNEIVYDEMGNVIDTVQAKPVLEE